jgi:hypothetical protein
MLGNLNIPWKKSKTLLKGTKEKNVTSAVQSLGCTHDWHHVQDRPVSVGVNIDDEVMMKLGYCPLCKTSQIFTKEDWDAVIKIQEIERKYKR